MYISYGLIMDMGLGLGLGLGLRVEGGGFKVWGSGCRNVTRDL